jgi:hypothetical protein
LPSVSRSIHDRRVGGIFSPPGHVGLLDVVADVLARPPAEDHQVEQAVGSQAVGAVNRDAGALAGGIESLHDGALAVHDHAAVDVRGDAAHGVVGRGQHRYGGVGRIDAQIGLAEAADVRQFGLEGLLAQMGGIQMHIVVDFAVTANALTGADFRQDGAGHDVAGRQIQQGGGIALHEPLSVAIAQDAAFTANRLGDQDPQPHDAGGVKLEELHVHQRDAPPGADRRAVTGVGESIGGDLEHAAETAGGKEDCLGGQDMQGRRWRVPRPPPPLQEVPSFMIRSTTWYSSKKVTSFLMHCW